MPERPLSCFAQAVLVPTLIITSVVIPFASTFGPSLERSHSIRTAFNEAVVGVGVVLAVNIALSALALAYLKLFPFEPPKNQG